MSICLWSLSSGRCSRSIVNIYHWYKKYKNLHKTQFLQNRKVKSNIFLFLKGFKSMSPIKGAVTMRPPMGRMDCRERGIVKHCIIAYKTTRIFYIKQLLLNTEAVTRIQTIPVFSFLYFISLLSFSFYTVHNDNFHQEQTDTALLCWQWCWICLSHLQSKYCTNNMRHNYLQKIPLNYI